MTGLDADRDPFAPPRARDPTPTGRKVARAVAIALGSISAYTAVAGLIAFSFTGSGWGVVASLIWGVPALGFTALALRLGR